MTGGWTGAEVILWSTVAELGFWQPGVSSQVAEVMREFG